MNEEARQRIDILQKERRRGLIRNSFLIATSTATVLMSIVLWSVLTQRDQDIVVYVQEAQKTIKVACEAAEGQPLPAEVQQSCNAAKRNELPKVLESVVDNPDPDDPEKQDAERQDPETQDSEIQDPEVQDSETQDPEDPDSEVDDADPDDPEIQESEIQEPEIQEPEEQGSPVCPDGYSQKVFHYYGSNTVDDPDGPNGEPGGDDQDWLLCVRN